jgi:hypothetical protein
MRIITEPEFAATIRDLLLSDRFVDCQFVTGPGRSGAVAAVYASHILRIPFVPFVPFGTPASCWTPRHALLIIDTATESGKTLRKAARKYAGCCPLVAAVFHEPPRVAFWYEATKPQRYRHEEAE